LPSALESRGARRVFRFLRVRLTVAGIAAAMCATAFAQVFECTDAKGGKVYANVCPAGTVQQREVVKKGEGAAAPGGASPAATLQEQDIGFRKRQLERDEAAAKEEQEKAKAQENQAECERARGELKGLESGLRITRTDPETGARTVIGDDERAAEIATAREQVKQWCKE